MRGLLKDLGLTLLSSLNSANNQKNAHKQLEPSMDPPAMPGGIELQGVGVGTTGSVASCGALVGHAKTKGPFGGVLAGRNVEVPLR